MSQRLAKSAGILFGGYTLLQILPNIRLGLAIQAGQFLFRPFFKSNLPSQVPAPPLPGNKSEFYRPVHPLFLF